MLPPPTRLGASAWILAALLMGGCLAPVGDVPAPDDAGVPFGGAAHPFGQARVVALVPGGFHAEGLALVEDRVFVGTAQGAAATLVPAASLGAPSRIFVFDLTSGALQDTILVEGEDTSQYYGLAGLKSDADGRVYAAAFGDARSLGVVRFVQGAQGWRQETYAELPDLPVCALSPPPCSPTLRDRRPLANDMAWDEEGNLYVTDSFQATVWRVRPGVPPRTVEPWYQHPDLDRTYGANGIRIGPGGDRMFIGVCCPDSLSAGPLDRAARIVVVPFPDSRSGPAEVFATFANGEGPDGFAFDDAGRLWVVSNLGEKLLVLGPDGSVLRTLTNADLRGASFHFPASLAFRPEARSLLVTNYDWPGASTAPDARSVVEVMVDARPFPEALPRVP